MLYFIYMKERMIAGENGLAGLLVDTFAEDFCCIFLCVAVCVIFREKGQLNGGNVTDCYKNSQINRKSSVLCSNRNVLNIPSLDFSPNEMYIGGRLVWMSCGEDRLYVPNRLTSVH